MALLVAAASCGLVAGIGDSYHAADGSDGGAARDAGRGEGAAPSAEDCLNGVDDDGNGFVDCQDSQCVSGGFTCVDAPPQGWDGVAVTRRDPSDTTVAPGCGDGGAAKVYLEGLGATPTACTPCGCGKEDGGACYAAFSCYSDGTCGGAPKAPTPIAIGPTCTAEQGLGGANSCKVTGTFADGGACPPDGGTLAAPVPWAHRADVCATGVVGGKGCPGTQVCVNRGANRPQIACLRARTGLACPAGWSATVDLYPKDGGTDTRGCAPCTCAAPTGASCNGAATVTVNSDTDCTGGTNFSVTNTCVAGGNFPNTIQTGWGGKSSGATFNPGSCAAQGGQPTGAFNPGAPEAFCCAP